MHDAMAFLSRYIQFDTTGMNEMPAAQWLAGQIREFGLPADVAVHEPAPGRGLVIARFAGTEPLKPLLLNHHIDVVAADPAQWTHPPFGGEIADGFVYGRGALDDKSMGVAFLFALRELTREGAVFRRPVVYAAVPDEELGGDCGTGWLASGNADVDPEWVWDEGGAGFVGLFGPTPQFGIAVCEKQIHHVRVIAQGAPGHGSMPHRNNPNDKLVRAVRWVLGNPRPMRLSETTQTMFETLAPTQPPATRRLLERLDSPVAQRLAGSRLSRDPQLNVVRARHDQSECHPRAATRAT